MKKVTKAKPKKTKKPKKQTQVEQAKEFMKWATVKYRKLMSQLAYE